MVVAPRLALECRRAARSFRLAGEVRSGIPLFLAAEDPEILDQVFLNIWPPKHYCSTNLDVRKEALSGVRIDSAWGLFQAGRQLASGQPLARAGIRVTGLYRVGMNLSHAH